MLTDYFPSAKPISKLKNELEVILGKQSLETKNTLWALSICSEGSCSSLYKLIDSMSVTGIFNLGGLSGIPFTGKTGLDTFVSHIPGYEGGLVIYGPHIGVTENGTFGKVNLYGSNEETTCCKPLALGLQNVKNGNVLNISHHDYQQGQINKILIESFEEIQKSENQIITTTEIFFKQIKRELTDMISSNLPSLSEKPIILLGGIQINTAWDKEDYFEIRDVSVFNS